MMMNELAIPLNTMFATRNTDPHQELFREEVTRPHVARAGWRALV
jgi:hypothetical protein